MRALAVAFAVAIVLTGCASPSSQVETPTSATTPSSSPSASASPVPRPNVVFVLTDDLDTASVAYLPNVKKLLAAKGSTLSRYYVSLPWCCPSRATTLRGQYAHNTKVWTIGAPSGGFAKFHRLGLEESTVATWLRARGYRTGLFGKYLNGYPEEAVKPTYVPPGWDTWVSPVGGSPYRHYDYTLNENGRLQDYSTYLTDVLRDKARRFITADARPFFAYIATYSPHRPATPARRHEDMFGDVTAPRPPSYDEKDMTGKPAELRRLPRVTPGERREWDRLHRDRLRSLQAVDEMIGELVDTLRSTGRLHNTYLIFTSDNGHHIGQHRLAPGKNTPYEEDVRVPFIVRGPGVPARRRVDSPAGNIDIAPTLADLAGIRPPSFVDGRSLVPLLRAGAPGPWRQAFLLEQGRIPGFTRGPGEYHDLPPYRPAERDTAYLPPWAAIRTARHLYVEYVTGERELYDVVNDPYQRRNIASGNPLAGRLAARLGRLRSCAAQTCRAAEDAR